MKQFKEGQIVYWHDPAEETSGRYTVLDPMDQRNAEYTEEDIADFDDRMILIGNGVSQAEVYAGELDILCPFTPGEITQIEEQVRQNQEHRRELLEWMTQIIALYPDQTLSVPNRSYQTCDEVHDHCVVSAFKLKDGTLYAVLEYSFSPGRDAEVSDLPGMEDLFCHMAQMIKITSQCQ